MIYHSFQSPIGQLILCEKEAALSHLLFEGETLPPNCSEGSSPLLQEGKKQILAYLDGTRKNFELPLLLEGTNFQKKVWQALKTIAYGYTATYEEIAIQIKSPKAYRAVGNANNKNPLPLIIPCHRVLGKSKELTGYRGGLERKQKLLLLENPLFLQK